jgi:hypothetical protein
MLMSISLVAVVVPGVMLGYTGLNDLMQLIVGSVLSVLTYLALSLLLKVEAVLQVLDRLSRTFFKRPFPSAPSIKEALQ